MHVLAIGAHPDDIELGCGGSLLVHRRRGDAVTMLVMTTGTAGPGPTPVRLQEQEDAAALVGAGLEWGGFSDGDVPEGRAAIEVIERVIQATGAEVCYTHAPGDTHQDHRATSFATVAASRRLSRLLFYEAPSTREFVPNVYVDIDGLVEEKLDLIRVHLTQVLDSGLVDLEAVEAQARYRGFQARVRQAEAFETPRFLWNLGAGE